MIGPSSSTVEQLNGAADRTHQATGLSSDRMEIPSSNDKTSVPKDSTKLQGHDSHDDGECS